MIITATAEARVLSGGLTTDETIRLCRRLEDLDILFIEEPADQFDLGALKKISNHVNTPLAVGEQIYTRHGFRPILEALAASVLQPDVGNTGGIMETKKIAAMAEAYNTLIAPHVARARSRRLQPCSSMRAYRIS